MCKSLFSLAIAFLLAAGTVGPVRGDGDGRIDPRVERSVEKGLAYLAKAQREDGSWPGSYGRSAGVAGLCALAFMAHGDEPGVGDYGETIEKAVEYIVSCQDSRGVLSGGISPMYSHGFATLALAEVYGMSRDKDVGKALKKAVDLIVRAQNGEGGWRYSIGSPSSDITVTGCQMMALRAAQNAGIEVPKKVVESGIRYVKSCATADGGFSYQAGRFSGSGVARTGIGVAVLSLCGEYSSDQAKRGAEYLRYKPLERENYFYYGVYYCSQAMFQAGGSYWKDWNRQMTHAILDRQSADGSWPGSAGGVECCTAMALLALEVRWRLLPIYQR
jgi:squalene cyclase